MADTWRATAQAVTFASGKSMLALFNSAGSTRVVRVRRAFHFNNGTAAVTGVVTAMRLYRCTAASAGTTVTPVAHDTTNTALVANITARHGGTITDSDLFRQYIWSNDEPAVGGASMDEWECLIPFAEVWNAGYGDTAVQPIVCREAEGFHIKQQGTSAVQTNDFEIEFTNEAT